MKVSIPMILMSCFAITLHAQDSVKLKQIDSIVYAINHSGLKMEYDTVSTQNPLGGAGKTYLSMMRDKGELKKYEQRMISIVVDAGVSRSLITSSSFYYHKGQLIKVEEYAAGNGNKKNFDWYFEDEKPLYFTLESDRSAERAELLLSMAKLMRVQVERR